jgi:hypothetical protein
MGRAIVAVVAAFSLWTVLWLGCAAVAQAAFPEIVVPAQPLSHTGALMAFIACSIVISVIGGFVCAAISKHNAMKSVWVFALILLLVGVGIEASAWALTPVWYHLVFLALLVPATVWGGTLRASRAR